MKRNHILKVFKRDLFNTVRNPIALIIIVAICIIPALYAWVNIIACWDVYENTGFLPVAVINNDNTVLFNGDLINIGDDVIDALKDNDKIDWRFVSREEANKGLIEGRYYASIEIPSAFTSDFLSVMSDHPVKPHIVYRADTKANPVATKITDTAKNTLVQQIKGNFVSTVNETIFQSLNDVGEDADGKKENLIKSKDAIVAINRNVDMLDTTLKNVNIGSSNYQTFMTNMQFLMPSIQQSINVLKESKKDKEGILKSSQSVINDTLDHLDGNLDQAIQSNARIHDLVAELNDANHDLTQNQMDNIMLESLYQLDMLNNSITATIEYLTDIQQIDFNKDIADAQNQLIELRDSLVELRTELVNLQTSLTSASQSLSDLSKTLTDLMTYLEDNEDNINDTLDSTIKTLKELDASTPTYDFSDVIKQLEELQASDPVGSLLEELSSLQTSVDDLKVQVDEVNKSISGVVASIDSVVAQLNKSIELLDKAKDDTGNRDARIYVINDDLMDIQSYISDQQRQLGQIKQNLDKGNGIAKDLLDQVNDTVDQTSTALLKAQKNYASGAKEDIRVIFNNSIIVTQDAELMIDSLQKLTDQISDTVTSAAKGGQMTSDIAKELNDLLDDTRSVVSLMGERFELIDNRDINLVINLLQSNPEFMGDFMSNPFDLKTETINAVPNYGSSMAPIYSTLALWVGCLFLNSVLKTHPGEFEGSEQITIREKHYGKMLYFNTLAFIQGTVISIGDIFLLKIHVMSAAIFILYCMLSSIVFSTITYTLKSTLSNLGKALSIIYMILQLAGSGGTYPIQVDPLIFRILQPLFPFTYTVNGLREAVAGPIAINVLSNIIALVIFAVVFNLYGYLTIEKLYPKVRRFELKMKESKLGE